MFRSISLFICVLSYIAFSQQTIRGTVTDFNTSQPVAGVLVQCVASPSISGATDVAGQFSIGGATAILKPLTNRIFQIPGNSSLMFSYRAGTGPVKVAVYDCTGRCLATQTLTGLTTGFYQLGSAINTNETNAMLVRIVTLTLSSCKKASRKIVSDQASVLVKRLSSDPAETGARKKLAADSLGFTKTGYIKKQLALSSYNVDLGTVQMQTIAAAKPSAPSATAQSCSKIKLSWTDNAAEETGYLIWRVLGTGPLSLVQTCPANADSFVDSTVLGGQRYGYRISAVFAQKDSVKSDSVSCQLPACPPKAPYGASISAITQTSLTLSWLDSTVGDHTGFIVQRRRSPDTTFAEIARTAANVPMFGDTGLLPAEQYFYRIYSYNPVGQSASFATASITSTPLDAFDWRSAVVYYAFIDRFKDGNVANNQPVSGAETAADFQGGDLSGLIQKLQTGYFSNLGVNVLWLSGFMANATVAETGSDTHKYAAYQGKWPIDVSSVDPRFGASSDLILLVRTAHEQGMHVIVDFEANHMHASSAIFANHSDWFWPVCVCGGSACPWSGPVQSCWLASYLPDLNLAYPAAGTFVASAALKWASEYSLDGMVLSDVQHIDPSWIGQLKTAVNSQFVRRTSPFPLFGATITSFEPTIRSLIDTATLLNGQVNYPLRAKIINSVLLKIAPMSDLASYCTTNDAYYGNGSLMLNMLDVPEFPRTIHMAENTPLYTAWDLGASTAWSGQPSQPSMDSVYQRLGVALELLLAGPGIPALFYGEEVGLAGGGTPDNHRLMTWTALSPLLSALQSQIYHLSVFRAQTPALYAGVRTTISSDVDYWVYSMSDGTNTVYVAANRSDVSSSAPGLPSGSYQDVIRGSVMATPITIPARSVFVLVKQ